jgi:hypothetical protein
MRIGFVLGYLAVFIAAPVAAQEPACPVSLPAIDPRYRNPWPDEWEKEFLARAGAVLKAQTAAQKADGLGGRTYFENEKRAYGILMAHLLAGDRDRAVRELQREDAQADSWHRHTRGIDYYACFTLKHQMRKYFLFGEFLDREYRQRMYDGARVWTENDPLRRPHHAYVMPGEGWGPDVKNSWVDVRSTENLFLMRVTSVYLMAEETKNEETRKRYKETILRYAAALYRVGMGEWDSENYHGHSIAPLLNLHDFARDADVRAAAKACLDYLLTVGAVKYYRGAFNGPTNRDYNHTQPFGGSAACMLWLYFGDTPVENHQFESDEIHVVTSRYRPPPSVVHLARKNFTRPAELFAAKPHYTASTAGDLKSPPAYFETQYFGRTFLMGSLAGGTTAGETAVNGFKITVWDEEHGALAIQGVPGPDPAYVGSAKYVEGKVAGENRVGQNCDVAVWLVEKGGSPWVWTIPDEVSVEVADGVTFLRADRSWVALRPLNATAPALDEALTRQLLTPSKGDSPWRGHYVLSSRGAGGDYCGVAVEVGEAPEHKDYAAFKETVLSRASADTSRIREGVASYTGSAGQTVKLRFAATVTDSEVWRDGTLHDWGTHAAYAFRGAGGKEGIVEQQWGGGQVIVRAGGKAFRCTVSESGIVEFQNE